MSSGKLRAVLWDLDGVIADTGRYHCLAWQEIFTPMGIDFTEEHFIKHFGQRNDTIIRDSVGKTISKEKLEDIASRKEKAYRHLVADNIQALPGAVDLLKALEKNEIPSAIASSAPLENVSVILKGLGIEGLFKAIACGREVTEGKPSPQIFLKAAEKLATSPADCLVIEDAVTGVAGAKRAGMKCVAVTNSHSGDRLREADLVITSLEEIDIDALSRLFN
jgi:beta-phosphoglucomutase family hydrolase